MHDSLVNIYIGKVCYGNQIARGTKLKLGEGEMGCGIRRHNIEAIHISEGKVGISIKEVREIDEVKGVTCWIGGCMRDDKAMHERCR